MGLASTGTVAGRPVALAPSTSPDAAGSILEALACLSPYGDRSPAALTSTFTLGSAPGTSLLLVSVDGDEDLVLALREARRRGVPVTALWILEAGGSPPPAHPFDDTLYAEVPDGWRDQRTLTIHR